MSDFKFLCKMGEGFYNLSVDFAVAPFTNIRNQMSFIKLKSGRFLVVDTCVFSAEVKREIDELTNNGELIDAVIGTHPYHTGGFAPFMKLYPGVPLWIGAPRHLLVCTEIPWDKKTIDQVLDKFISDDVIMSIPAGSNFINHSEKDGDDHFSSVFVMHVPSKTLHVDDTFGYLDEHGPFKCLLYCCAGIPMSDHFYVHPTLLQKGCGVTTEADGGQKFLEWIDLVVGKWNIDNVCTAHSDNLVGDGQDRIKKVIDKVRAKLVGGAGGGSTSIGEVRPALHENED